MTPADLVYDLALSSMGQVQCAVAPIASVVSYNLKANSLSPIPIAIVGDGVGLLVSNSLLPAIEFIFDDVFRSSPGTMVEMQGRKKKRLIGL